MKKILIPLVLLALVVSMTACSVGLIPPAPERSTVSESASRPAETAPETVSPETAAAPAFDSVPETSASEPAAPETAIPETAAPEPDVPEATVPETSAPQSEALQTSQLSAATYFLNELNYAPDLNQVSVKPGYVRYEDGRLVADCFVINGLTNKTIHNIRVNSLEFYDGNGQLIAGASFGALENLVLGPNQYAVWTFSFTGEAVSNACADLSYLDCRSDTEYYY